MLALTLDVTLPTWLDAERMKTLMVGAMGVMLTVGLVSLWMAKKLVTRVAYVSLSVILLVATWTQRSNLIECANKIGNAESQKTTCDVFGFTVQVPTDRIPAVPASPEATVA
jgi:hypothetical protein